MLCLFKMIPFAYSIRLKTEIGQGALQNWCVTEGHCLSRHIKVDANLQNELYKIHFVSLNEQFLYFVFLSHLPKL